MLFPSPDLKLAHFCLYLNRENRYMVIDIPLLMSTIKVLCVDVVKYLDSCLVPKISKHHFLIYSLGAWRLAYKQLLNKPYVNEVFERAKLTLKMPTAAWFLVYFFKRFRSFNTANIESVSQKAAKLLSIKIWKWFDPGPAHTFALKAEAEDFSLRPPIFTASNFKSLWPVFFAFDL